MPFETSRDTWVHVLDLLTELQSAAPAFPMPSGEHGLTTIDARFVIDAGSVTAALMNGDLNAPRYHNHADVPISVTLGKIWVRLL